MKTLLILYNISLLNKVNLEGNFAKLKPFAIFFKLVNSILTKLPSMLAMICRLWECWERYSHEKALKNQELYLKRSENGRSSSYLPAVKS